MDDPSQNPRELPWRELIQVLEVELARSAEGGEPRGVLADPALATAHAWKELFRRVHDLATIAVDSLGARDRLDPDDLTQDALFLLLRQDRLHKLGSVVAPGAYLMAVLRNLARDRFRQFGAQARVEMELERAIGGQSYLTLDDSDAALFAFEVFQRLSPDEMVLVRLRFWEDRSIQDIADELGLTYAAVAQRLSKLMRRLHNDLGK